MTAPFDAIRADFELLDDWEDRYRYLIELGRALEPLADGAQRYASRLFNPAFLRARDLPVPEWLEASSPLAVPTPLLDPFDYAAEAIPMSDPDAAAIFSE